MNLTVLTANEKRLFPPYLILLFTMSSLDNWFADSKIVFADSNPPNYTVTVPFVPWIALI